MTVVFLVLNSHHLSRITAGKCQYSLGPYSCLEKHKVHVRSPVTYFSYDVRVQTSHL